MSRTKVIVIVALALFAVAMSVPAEAHGGRARVSVGFAFGGPWYYPAYYYPYYPYYYYPQAVAVQSEPTVYIERGDSSAPAERSSLDYWYYCAESKTYHPYVKHCPGGWQKQIPTVPDR